MLGQFVVEIGQRTIADDAWSRRKARQLFKYLLTRPRRRAMRDEVIALLWPDSDPEAAAINLRSAVHTIRRTFAAASSAGADALVVLDRDTVGLRAGPALWADADAFERVLARAREATEPLPILEEADALYGGDYLPDDLYEDWAAQRRDALRREWVELQRALAEECERRGELAPAAAALRRLFEADPCNERAAGELMRVLARRGAAFGREAGL